MRKPIKLLNLIRDNLATPRQFDIKSQGDEATIYLYDVIDPYFGISAEAFVTALNSISAPKINLRINSPGGDVFEARAMATAIRQHAGTIVAHIDGVAASASTWVATASKEVHISDGAFMMVHKSWGMSIGNADEMRSLADLLDKIDLTIIADYMKKTGADQSVVGAWMAEETWFTAQEAVDAKLADVLVATESNGGSQNRWNLSAYAKAPKALTQPPAPVAPVFDRAAMDRRVTLLERIAA